MKKRYPATGLMTLLLSCCLVQPLFAFNHYQIDVDALKELTGTDTFEVKITKKTVTDDVNKTFGEQPDMLTLTMANDTGKTIESLKVMIVAYDAENKAVELESSLSVDMASGCEKREFALKEFAPDNGAASTISLNLPCTHDNFTGAQALVASYTADGEEVMNPLAEEWNELALGSPTHILD